MRHPRLVRRIIVVASTVFGGWHRVELLCRTARPAGAPRRTVTGCLLACLCFIAIPADAIGQANERPGRWLPFNVDNLGGWETHISDPSFPVSRQDIAQVIVKLTEINNAFQNVPALAPPRGMEVRPARRVKHDTWRHLSLLDQIRSGDRPIPSTLLIQMFVPTIEIAGESQGHFEVTVNIIEDLFARTGLSYREDERGSMYLEPRVTGNIAGFPFYETGYVVMKSNDRPLWVPVSQERFIRNELREAEMTLKEIESNLPESDVDQQIEEMRRNLESVLEQVKGLLSEEEFEQQKREMEAARRELEATLRAQQPQFAALLTQARQRVTELNNELNSLTAAQRASEAWIVEPDSIEKGKKLRPSMLANIGEKGMARVVKVNSDYFDTSLPRTSFQVIAVSRYVSQMYRDTENVVRPVSDSVWETLDWKRIAATLDRLGGDR